MTQLLLVRHGEPHAATGEPGSSQGADPGLTEEGHAQAARFSRWLAGAPDRDRVVEVVVSPMRRAVESVAPVAADLGLEPVVAEGLAEYDRGHHVYRPVRELAESDDPDWARVRAGWFPTFVDVDAFRARVLGAFDEITARHAGRDSVLVLCHAGTINVYLAALLGLEHPLTFPLDHLGVSRVLVSRSGERRVRSVNETQHVAEVL